MCYLYYLFIFIARKIPEGDSEFQHTCLDLQMYSGWVHRGTTELVERKGKIKTHLSHLVKIACEFQGRIRHCGTTELFEKDNMGLIWFIYSYSSQVKSRGGFFLTQVPRSSDVHWVGASRHQGTVFEKNISLFNTWINIYRKCNSWGGFDVSPYQPRSSDVHRVGASRHHELFTQKYRLF